MDSPTRTPGGRPGCSRSPGQDVMVLASDHELAGRGGQLLCGVPVEGDGAAKAEFQKHSAMLAERLASEILDSRCGPTSAWPSPREVRPEPHGNC